MHKHQGLVISPRQRPGQGSAVEHRTDEARPAETPQENTMEGQNQHVADADRITKIVNEETSVSMMVKKLLRDPEMFDQSHKDAILVKAAEALIYDKRGDAAVNDLKNYLRTVAMTLRFMDTPHATE